MQSNLQRGRAMAQAVSRRPLTAAAWIRARVNPVGFVVEKVALGQVFLRILRFSPVNIIAPWAPHFRKLKKNSPLHSSSSWDGQKARKSGRSPVRRQSHPYNQNIRTLQDLYPGKEVLLIIPGTSFQVVPLSKARVLRPRER
jgi:hypothetical protein